MKTRDAVSSERLLRGRGATRAAKLLTAAWDDFCDIVDDEH